MRKFCLVMLLIVLAALLFPVTRNDARTRFESMSLSEMKLHFDVGEFALNEVNEGGVVYTVIEYDGARTEKKGYAEIPFRSVAVQLSPDSSYDLTVISADYEEVALDHPLIPSRGVLYRNQDLSSIPFVTDPASLRDEIFPGKIAEMTDPFIFRDVRGTNVIFYPFQYNPVKRTLRIYRSITVGLKENGQTPHNPIKSINTDVAPEMYEMYRSLFINFNQDTKFTHELGQMGEMLVIYTSRDASVIQPYVDWKREKGFKVHLLQVANGTNVRSVIQNAYNNNPNILYVQLVGGWDNIKTDTMSFDGNPEAPMDPMLGCVVGSDIYPDLIIGRFSARSSAEVTTHINKVINYEKNPDMSGTWYKNAMGMARDEGSGGGHHGGEADDYHMEVIRYYKLSPYNYSTVYQEYDGNSSYVGSNTTSSIVSSRINAGIGLLNYCNHGYETGWSVANYSNTHVNNLTNNDKLPFVWSVACLVGKFNRTSECFAEAWLNNQNGGAVGFLGSTINQPWVPPMSGQDYFNDLLIGGYDYTSNPGGGQSTTAANKRTTFGALSFNGMILMLSDAPSNSSYQETIRTWTLFGDASLQVRTDTPKTVTVSNTSVDEGTAFTTNIKANSVNFQNALVSLYQNGNTFSGLTNSNGNVTINHSLEVGEAKLTITGYNTETKYLDITVGGSGVPNPTNFSASIHGHDRIDLGWTKNASNNNVMLAFSTTGTFGTPSGTYSVGQTISGGGTVIYRSSGTSHSHTGLDPSTTYYYRAWSYDGSNDYSSGTNTQGTTSDAPLSLPFTENFNSSSIPAGWAQINSEGVTDRWTVSNTANAGGSAYEMRAAWQNINPGTTRLVTPPLNSSGQTSLDLSFRHMLDGYGTGATLKIQSSSDGSVWTDESWSVETTSSNVGPEIVNVSIINNVGSVTYIAFVITGNLYQFDYWYVDNVSVTAPVTLDPPTATTLAAGSVTTDGATLNGTVNANGESTTVTFEYGLTTSYGSSVAATPGTVTGTSNTSVSASISGLEEATTYNFRVKAVSAGGTTYGSNQTFTTDTAVQPVEPPTNLIAEVDGADVLLTWTAPAGSEPDTFDDSFETYSDFVLSFEPWILIDGDGSPTYGSVDADFPNQNYTGSYIIFNPSQTEPPLSGNWYPRSGSKYAACFNATSGPNNDWMITPQLQIGNGYNFSFYAKSVTDEYGLERFRVGVSTTGTNQGDFTIITPGSYVEVPTSWTNYSYDLSSYAGQTVYLAINCVSDDAFVFMVDDVTVNNSKGEAVFSENYESKLSTESELSYSRSEFSGKDSPVAPTNDMDRSDRSTLSGYKVYRNGSVIATITDPAVTTYSDTGLSNGDYDYYVTANYTDPAAESDPSNTESVNISVQYVVDTFPWAESFEGSIFVPEHWSLESVSSNTWETTESLTIGETTYYPADGSKMAYVQWHGTDTQNEWLITPVLDLSSLASPEIYFYFMGSYHWSVTETNCMLKLMQRADGGSWNEIWRASDHAYFNSDYTNYTWLETVLPINADAKGILQFAFVYEGTDGANFAIDGIIVSGELEGPRDFVVTSADGVEVTLSWNYVEGATYYNVYRSTDPYGAFTLVGSTESNSYVDTPPSSERMHFYYLTAANDSKRSDEENETVIPVRSKMRTMDTVR